MPKKKYRTLRFMVYLYEGGTPTQEARGTIAFYGKGEKQLDQQTFNHWDEIISGMRKLLRKAGYIKRSDEDGCSRKDKLNWEFEVKNGNMVIVVRPIRGSKK